jgi:hypothetical protein
VAEVAVLGQQQTVAQEVRAVLVVEELVVILK